MEACQLLVTAIRRVQTEITWLSPGRGYGLRPNPGASERAVAEAEQRLGIPLPPSYRAFLMLNDGWPLFFEGADLLPARELGHAAHAELVAAISEAAETPVPDIGPPSRRARTRPRLVPFGLDRQACTLFAFNPAVCQKDGEYEVISWFNEIGVRKDSFEGMLEMVLELCQQELDSLLLSCSAA